MKQSIAIIFLIFCWHTTTWAEAATSIAKQFWGTWKLISITRDTIPASTKIDSYGHHPSGYLSYSPDGRMMTIIVGDRKTPTGTVTSAEAVALFNSMTSYAGTYTIMNDRIIHHVAVSWNQKWTGTDQIRFYKFSGNQLTLSMLPFTDPKDGKVYVDSLVWQKVKS